MESEFNSIGTQLLRSHIRGAFALCTLFTPFHPPLHPHFSPLSFTPSCLLQVEIAGRDCILMMRNHLMTSTFMMHRPCMASFFMHDKMDWWVEYNARVGIDISLKDESSESTIRSAWPQVVPGQRIPLSHVLHRVRHSRTPATLLVSQSGRRYPGDPLSGQRYAH